MSKKSIFSFIGTVVVLLSVLFMYFRFRTDIRESRLDNTNLSNLRISGYSLGDKFIRGRDFNKETNGLDGLTDYNQRKLNEFCITTKDDSIVGLSSMGLNSHSSKGLKFGESVHEVKKVFGKNFDNETSERLGDMLVYKDKKHKFKLIFSVNEKQKVVGIVLYNYQLYDYQF